MFLVFFFRMTCCLSGFVLILFSFSEYFQASEKVPFNILLLIIYLQVIINAAKKKKMKSDKGKENNGVTLLWQSGEQNVPSPFLLLIVSHQENAVQRSQGPKGWAVCRLHAPLTSCYLTMAWQPRKLLFLNCLIALGSNKFSFLSQKKK